MRLVAPQPWGGLARSSSPTTARPYSYIPTHLATHLLISSHISSYILRYPSYILIYPHIFSYLLTACTHISWHLISPVSMVILYFNSKWPKIFTCSRFFFAFSPFLLCTCTCVCNQMFGWSNVFALHLDIDGPPKRRYNVDLTWLERLLLSYEWSLVNVLTK